MPAKKSQSLNQKRVDALGPGHPREFEWDDEVRGFGVRIKPSGAASYLIQYRNTDGRTRRFVLGSTGALTLKAARKKARTALASVSGGGDPSAERKEQRAALTMAALGNYFLNVYAVENNLSRPYLRDCRAFLERIINPRWGTKKAKSINRDDIRRLKIDLKNTPTRANRVLALLSRMFSLAIEQNERTDNPCVGIERNMENRRERFLSLKELEDLMVQLRAEEDQLQADAVRLLILTGARVGEMLSAEWTHFNLDTGMWTKPPTNTKQRRVHHAPLSEPAIDILKRMHASRDRTSPYLFPNPRNPARPRGDIRAFWEKVRTAAALGDETRLYDCRHTYASHLLVIGVPLGVIGKLMGHSQPATTARYAHVADSVSRAATAKMGEIILSVGAVAKI